MDSFPAAVVIPARFGSKRFPGKPLAPIAGVPMLERVWNIARSAIAAVPGARALVATDDARILDFAAARGMDAVMTAPDCPTGSDRVLAALAARGWNPEVACNLQGDNPACPAEVVAGLIRSLLAGAGSWQVATPALRLSWTALDRLREKKLATPASGTFAVFRVDETESPAPPPPEPAGADWTSPPALARGRALYFSKREIPLLRDEAGERARSPFWAPLYQHIGLYAYRLEALRRFAAAPPARSEKLEQLEQLRFLEMDIPVRVVEVDLGGHPWPTGVDAPSDVARVEELLRRRETAPSGA